jgi:hypothetical protein
MSEKVTVEDVDSTAYRVVELLLFVPLVFIAVVGIAIVGVGAVGPHPSGLAAMALGGGVIVGYLFLLLSPLAISVTLYLDAKAVTASDAGWDPSPGLYAVFGLFFSYLTALHYVWQRHNYVVDRVDSEAWVKLVIVGALAPPLFTAVFVLLGSANVPETLILVPLALTAVVAGLFPIALYKDATYVRLRSGDWQPNPGNYIAIGLFLWLFAMITYPLTGAYYLARRYRAIGI